MHIAVIGPGGIGCLFSGLLAEAGHDVCLIDRRPDRAALIAREGLIIESRGKSRVIRLDAGAFPADAGQVDLIILCVKAHETAGTIPSIITLAAPQTNVLSFQNGLGNMDVFRQAAEKNNLFAGVTNHGATVIGLNHIRHAGAGLTSIGSFNHNHAGAEIIAKMLSKAGIETSASEDTTGLLWSKLVINAAICPISVISGLANGEIAGNARWRSLLCKAAEESGKIAAAKGIKLSFADPAKAVLEVCENTSENISSMLQDIRRGRQTEIMQINGAIVRAAAELGIDTPTNTMLYHSVVDLEKRAEHK